MFRRVGLTLVPPAFALTLLAPAAAQEAARPEAPKPPAEAQEAARPETPAEAKEAGKPDTKPPVDATKPAEPRRGPGATLRVQVVITRFQGEKKLASLPYTFTVSVNGRPTRMRMGVDTPIAVATSAGAEGVRPPTNVQYRNVGTNIDCTAHGMDGARYQLRLSIENSSALPGETGATGAPLFRRFDTNIDPVLRDGQSVQAVASTDPVTGEVVKIDVALNEVR